MPISRAIARSDSPAAPSVASCRRAISVISLMSSALTRSRALRLAFTDDSIPEHRSPTKSVALEARAERDAAARTQQRGRKAALIRPPPASYAATVTASRVRHRDLEQLADPAGARAEVGDVERVADLHHAARVGQTGAGQHRPVTVRRDLDQRPGLVGSGQAVLRHLQDVHVALVVEDDVDDVGESPGEDLRLLARHHAPDPRRALEV